MAKHVNERMREYRKRKAQAGLSQVSAMVHPSQRADVLALCRLLASNPDLTVTLATDQVSGRIVSVSKALRAIDCS